MLCERCGSIQTARARATFVDKILLLLTGREPFICRRCGWRARRAWDDNARVDRRTAVDPSTAYDPNLVALDTKQNLPVRAPKELVAQDADFDLSVLDQTSLAPAAEEPERPVRRSRRRTRSWLRLRR